MGWRKLLKYDASGEAGVTLLETMVALGILSLGLTLIGNGVFQVLSIQRYWQDQHVATKDLRHVGSWFAGDALNAQSVLIGGSPSGTNVTLSWTDSANVAHTAVYSLSGGNLIRDFDGVSSILAQSVVSANWDLTGNVVTMTLETEADGNTTETITLQTYLRVLQP